MDDDALPKYPARDEGAVPPKPSTNRARKIAPLDRDPGFMGRAFRGVDAADIGWDHRDAEGRERFRRGLRMVLWGGLLLPFVVMVVLIVLDAGERTTVIITVATALSCLTMAGYAGLELRTHRE